MKIETLETRLLFATLTINGTGSADNIWLEIIGSDYSINLNGTTSTMPLADVTSIVINGQNGQDTINIDALQHPATVSGGSGDDTIEFAPNTRQISNIAQNVSVDGGTGVNKIRFRDNANYIWNNSHTLTPTSYSTTTGAPISFASIAEIRVHCGERDDQITVNGTPTNSAVYIQPNRHLDDIRVNETGAGSFVSIDMTNNTGNPDSLFVNTDNVGTAVVRFDAWTAFGGLHIGNGGRVNMTTGGNKLLRLYSPIDITPGGMLDLNDNDILMNYPGSSPLAAMQALINAGRNEGAWNGVGITSTSAATASNHNTTLAVIEGAQYLAMHGEGATFNGEYVYENSLLVKYTYYGDADLNGQVDFDDYVRTDTGFNGAGNEWIEGDFDGNGSVDFDDYVLLDLGFNSQGAAL